MRHRRISAAPILAAAALVFLFAGPGHSDLLTTSDDQMIEGKLVSFRNGSFRFEANGEATDYPADQVRSISITTPVATEDTNTGADQVMLQQMSQSLAALHQRIDALGYQIEQLSSVQGQKMDNLQQRAFELNPVSRMSIEEQKSNFARNGSFVVEGFIRNYSGVMVYNPEVRIDLVGPNETPVYSEVVEANVSSVGPNSRARFRAVVPNPPKFDVYYVTPVLTTRQDPGLGSEMEPGYLYNQRRGR
jgi:hypothetical protein